MIFKRYLALLVIGPVLATGAVIDPPDSITTVVFDKPAGEPTTKMARGPLLGNGDVGVMQGGLGDRLIYYIGKNDFWSQKHQAPIAVGQVRVSTPALAGASFHVEEDMKLAEIRGAYAKGDAALTSRAYVDANANLLCVELRNTGTQSLDLSVSTIQGAEAAGTKAPPAAILDNGKPAKLGNEQHGGGRWFFQGELSGVQVQDQALGLPQIAELAKGLPMKAQAFDGKTSLPLDAPKITDALTISGWIKVATFSPTEGNYIVSKGEWKDSYSLGLSAGQPRFALGDYFLQADAPLPLNQWVHVAGVYDGKSAALFINGKPVKSSGRPADAGASFLYAPDGEKPGARQVGVATRVLGADSSSFTLKPGNTVCVVAAILSDLDAEGQKPLVKAEAQVASLTKEKLAARNAAHRAWWKEFWSRSFIEIPDKTIEQCWYAAWYIMGACSREGEVAPGLWGNWITTNVPDWHGDFHLNYNFQAPFYGLYSANHADTALPFYEAMNQMIPRGREIAKKRGWKGIHLPVSMGPWGMCPEGEGSDWGQRSNALYSALNFITYWQSTQDEVWLKKTAYPYLREVALFWEDYLKFKEGRYVVENDAIHEGHSPTDVNPILSLGMLKTFFGNMPAMSEVVGLDADKRTKWRDIHDKMSPFPTQERGGKTIFRYTEKGTPWWGDNTLGIQHIFPAGAIGLDSDPKLLELSHNMIDAMGRWKDNNGMSSWYTACARVGYDPRKILTEMRHMYDGHTLPNKLLNFGGGGIENVSPSLAVTEMLMQSHEGVLRFFPCWPKEMDARFSTLRARGAFLVSANLKGGEISGVTIRSEKGRDCTILNPWPGKAVRVTRNGKAAETVTGDRFTLITTPRETLGLVVP